MRSIRKPAVLCLTLALLLSLALPAAADQAPVQSSNANSQSYSRWASTVRSYLFENKLAGLTRLEYADGQVIVEDYSPSLQLQGSRTLPMELPLWGGAFSGSEYNFLIFGQSNPEEDDSLEVMRIVKYSKDWERLGQASICGANTVIPFSAGSLRCAEYNGYLYIRTCHEMYMSSDGYNHQANMTFQIRETDLSVMDSFYSVMNVGYGYVSHSFNQFILVDQNADLVALDHGDAYPRSAVLIRYGKKAGDTSFTGRCSYSDVQTFPGNIGDNSTGASLGGLAETANGYVSAYNYNEESLTSSGGRNIYLGYTTKEGLVSTTQKLTTTSGTTTPRLVSTGLDGGYILWNERSDPYTASDKLCYARYSDGGTVGPVQTATAQLSDCQPICWNGTVIWYTTLNSAPVFYLLDDSGLRSVPAGTAGTFADVPQGSWFHDPVIWALNREITNGMTDTSFGPDATCTQAQILTFLWRANGMPAPKGPVSLPQVPADQYYAPAIQWALEQGLVDETVSPDSPCTRGMAMTFLWKQAGSPAQTGSPFTDIPAGSPYAQAAAWAVEQEITNGMTATTFVPESTCTRAQIATFLYRAFA